MKKNVALIYGGEGYEREISALSAKNLFSLIDKALYNVFAVHIDAKGHWYTRHTPNIFDSELSGAGTDFFETFPAMLNGKSGLIADGDLISVDCAIPCLHGDFGEDGRIQGALSTAHIPYIGQDVYACAITNDKIYTKISAEHLEIPVAKWICSTDTSPSDLTERAEREIGYPLFIKPARLGSSFGAHPVRCKSDFISALDDALKYDERIIVEELVEFDYELECALIDSGERIILPGGRVFSGGSFYDFHSKYSKESSPRVEAKTRDFTETEQKASEYVRRLADFIGIRHLSRFDFFVTANGKVIFNEANAFPGMTETSLYPRLVSDACKGCSGFINMLIDKVCADGRCI